MGPNQVILEGSDNLHVLLIQAMLHILHEIYGNIGPCELTGRCDAAVAAARAFPDSILVCSGGATGGNNPEKHTEAGLMKAYMSEECGIDPERIFMDERAMTTDQNMLYSMKILQEQQVGTVTVVTSDYHQLRGQTLLCAMSEMVRRDQGYSVEIVGNWCWPTGTAGARQQGEFMSTLFQISSILELPYDEMTPVWDVMRGGG